MTARRVAYVLRLFPMISERMMKRPCSGQKNGPPWYGSNVIELRILICPIAVADGFPPERARSVRAGILPFTRNINGNGNLKVSATS